MTGSVQEQLAALPAHLRNAIIDNLPPEAQRDLQTTWRGFKARPNQLRPGTSGSENPRSDWIYWLLQGGRGVGKTRTGGETCREWVKEGRKRIHLVASTAADLRQVMIEGPSGLLSCYPENERPYYEPSKQHRLTWPNGAIAQGYSAEEPGRLRGPQCEAGWLDEIAAWAPQTASETWDNFAFGLRLGDNPQAVVTSTPKPVELFKQLVKDPDTVITRGSTYENKANLAPSFFAKIIKKYEGTRLGRQELLAELLEDIPGALWTRAIIDANRVNEREIVWDLIWRIVVAIDPAVTAGEDSDETGIIVAGLTRSGHVIVLDDLTCRESPLGWARIAVAAYKTHRGDRIVGEVNNGGDLVAANLRSVAPEIPFRAVRASRGKAVRAEPVAALYEQGRVHHVRYTKREESFVTDRFDLLEDQLCSFVPGVTEKSPDRMDALVWAITELVIDPDIETTYQFVQPVSISPI